MDQPYISASGLHKTYQMGKNVIRALDGVDLQIERNAFVAILGPSGSGKSTLLHLIGGLDRPSSGGLQVDGRALDSMDERALAEFRRDVVGFIFQSFHLVPSMTAEENVAFPLIFNRTPSRIRRTRARQLLDEVGLSTHLAHRPAELSGGQQQRVAVARALANHGQLILADEPTGNLDLQTGAHIMDLLEELHRSGRTVIVVSHDPRITRFATRIVYLLDGRVVPEVEYLTAIGGMESEAST